MSLLTDWINGDNWAAIRDKFNAAITAFNAVGGGLTNQVLAKNSNTDFDFKWIGTSADIPTLVANKVLTNDGTNLIWGEPMFDRQVNSAVVNAACPATGSSQTIATLIGLAGVNRDYKLEFTWSYNQITTTNEMYVEFWKNTVLIESFHHVATAINGHSDVSTVHFMDLNVAAAANYSVVIRAVANQYNLQNYCFSIDGTPTV